MITHRRLGEEPGITATVNLYPSLQQPAVRYVLLRSSSPASISPVEREYLHQTGVFTLLQAATCRELLRAYCCNVHPILPVLSLAKPQELETPVAAQLDSMLIFWSVAVVAVNASESCIESVLSS